MKILVTGGAGFIGSAFVRLVVAETGWDVVNLDKLTYAGNLENLAEVESSGRYRFVQGDIADQAAVGALVVGALWWRAAGRMAMKGATRPGKATRSSFA